MNTSATTRRGQILEALRETPSEWVDGSALATERVGGSEGLRRLRELRDDEGYNIQQRRHPDPGRNIWQYRLLEGPADLERRLVDEAIPAARGPRCPQCGRALERVEPLLGGYVTGLCLSDGKQTARYAS